MILLLSGTHTIRKGKLVSRYGQSAFDINANLTSFSNDWEYYEISITFLTLNKKSIASGMKYNDNIMTQIHPGIFVCQSCGRSITENDLLIYQATFFGYR